MAPKGSKTVPIKGSTEKRMITATLTITLTIILDGHFLPVQLIYGGKTSKSLPWVNFPNSFSFSANPKHYSNEQESIKGLGKNHHSLCEERKGTIGNGERPSAIINLGGD